MKQKRKKKLKTNNHIHRKRAISCPLCPSCGSKINVTILDYTSGGLRKYKDDICFNCKRKRLEKKLEPKRQRIREKILKQKKKEEELKKWIAWRKKQDEKLQNMINASGNRLMTEI